MAYEKDYKNLLSFAVQELQGDYSGKHALTRIMPYLFRDSDFLAIDSLSSEWTKRFSCCSKAFPYSAELITFLGAPKIDDEMRRRWTAAITGNKDLNSILGKKIEDLASVLGAAGIFSFSFPIWRFLSQRLTTPEGESIPALLEYAGMERLARETDIHSDEEGKKVDWLGTGYLTVQSDFEVEYRRAYIRVTAPDEGSLIIRNSSYFFGRDRFEHPAYFSLKSIPSEQLKALTPLDVDGQKKFLPLTSQQFWNSSPADVSDAVSKLFTLTKILLEHENNLTKWVFDSHASSPQYSPGFSVLLNNLAERIMYAEVNPGFSKYILPVLGFIDPQSPPWFPYHTLEVTKGNLASLSDLLKNENSSDEARIFMRAGQSRKCKLVLLSGTEGDYPLREK